MKWFKTQYGDLINLNNFRCFWYEADSEEECYVYATEQRPSFHKMIDEHEIVSTQEYIIWEIAEFETREEAQEYLAEIYDQLTTKISF